MEDGGEAVQRPLLSVVDLSTMANISPFCLVLWCEGSQERRRPGGDFIPSWPAGRPQDPSIRAPGPDPLIRVPGAVWTP